MTDIRIDRGAWVVVCDGTKALVLENVGSPTAPALKTLEVHDQVDPKTSQQGTDAPGRAFNSVSPARSAMDQTDWHAQAEFRFLADIARRLEAAVTAGATRALVLIAPPRALGMIRRCYSDRVLGALRAEIDRDLVRLPIPEIERRLAW